MLEPTLLRTGEEELAEQLLPWNVSQIQRLATNDERMSGVRILDAVVAMTAEAEIPAEAEEAGVLDEGLKARGRATQDATAAGEDAANPTEVECLVSVVLVMIQKNKISSQHRLLLVAE